jgi:PAS domain S-box-containing protein
MNKTLPFSPDLLYRAVETADDGIYVTDAAGRIVFANQAILTIVGYHEATFVGSRTSIFRSGKMSPEYYQRLWQTVLSGAVWREVIVNRRENGEFYEAFQTITPVLGDDGNVEFMIAVQRDLSKVRELERELTRSQTEVERLLDEKDTLLQEVYHRVKNDVEMVKSLLQLQAESAASPEAREAISLAAGRVAIISRTYGLLQDRGAGEDTSLSEFLDYLAANWRESVLPDRLRLEVAAGSERLASRFLISIGLLCNEGVTNASKYALAGTGSPNIVISVRMQEDPAGGASRIVVTIRDNGPGYPEDVISGARRGFGLKVVAAIVQQHNGRLSLRNDSGGVLEASLTP